jgi:hypothetical protein
VSCRIYQSPGRIRVRLNALKAGMSSQLLFELQNLPGVKSVLPSELTGSIVIYYDKDIRCSSSLLRIFRRHGLLENVVGFPSRSVLAIVPKEKPAGFIEVISLFLRKALRD